jgi:hypothetical protein
MHTHARTHGRSENIYSIFRDKLLLLGEHIQCTVNSFSGSHQWSMPLTFMGNKSIICSELYCYVFLHANVSYMNSLLLSDSDLSNEQNEPTCSIDNNNKYAQSCFYAIMAVDSKDDENKPPPP